MSMKNSNDTIGNRTRDLPTCSAVLQPTALPHAPKYRKQYNIFSSSTCVSLLALETLHKKTTIALLETGMLTDQHNLNKIRILFNTDPQASHTKPRSVADE
jgi:hypothetical protein